MANDSFEERPASLHHPTSCHSCLRALSHRFPPLTPVCLRAFLCVRACVIVANKWDAVDKDEKTFNEAIRYVREELFAVNWAEVTRLSGTCMPSSGPR